MTVTPRYKKLLPPEGHWAAITSTSDEEIDTFVRHALLRKNMSVHVVRGERCRTKKDLLNEWAAALQFPSSFGGNWDAFEDCLTDLEWLPGSMHLVVLTNALSALANDNAGWRTFIAILHAAAEEMQSHKSSLQFLFHVEEGKEETLRSRLLKSGISL